MTQCLFNVRLKVRETIISNPILRILKMSRAAQTLQASLERPVGRVFETPDIYICHYFLYSSWTEVVNKHCLVSECTSITTIILVWRKKNVTNTFFFFLTAKARKSDNFSDFCKHFRKVQIWSLEKRFLMIGSIVCIYISFQWSILPK